MITGIYAIINLINGHHYVGQAQSIVARWSVHVAELKNGRHHSTKLQRSWNKHGPENFIWIVLETSELEQLDRLEQKWMDRFLVCETGYNNQPTAGSCRGYKASIRTRELISLKAKLIGTDPEERKRRSERAKAQHASGSLGPHRLTEAGRKTMGKGAAPILFTNEVRANLRAAWTPERRAAQAEKVRALNKLGVTRQGRRT